MTQVQSLSPQCQVTTLGKSLQNSQHKPSHQQKKSVEELQNHGLVSASVAGFPLSERCLGTTCLICFLDVDRKVALTAKLP